MVEFDGGRRALFAAFIAAVLVACGRTEVLPTFGSSGPGDTTMSPGSAAGSAGQPTLPRAGAAGAAESTSGGQGGMSGAGGSAGTLLGGTAGGPFGGGAGEPGAAGMGAEGGVHPLRPCDRAEIPLLDGLLATPMERQPALSIAGDWNRDGNQDLVIGNTDISVSVLLGKGDGTFAPGVTYRSGLDNQQSSSSSLSLAAGDLDGNGSLDLVIAPRFSPRVSVLLGVGDGTFAAPVSYGLDRNSVELTLGDLDDDGHPDIAIASDRGAAWLPNHGDGSFGPSVAVATKPERLNSIAAGDLNHDGHLDLATLSDTELTVLIGNGDGSFVPGQAFSGGMYDDPVRIADINGDGHADLLYPQSCGPRSAGAWTRVFLGRGDGTFAGELSTFTTGGCNGHAAVADLNDDGATDVLLTSPLTVQFGARDGLLPPVKSLKASGGNLLGTGDWNGDGKPDLALAAEHWITVRLGNGDGTFGADLVYQAAFDALSVELADLDADGVLDIAVMSEATGEHGSTATALSVFRGMSAGTFGARVDYPSTLNASNLAVVDLDGDGWRDLVSSLDDAIIVRLGTGNGSIGPEVTVPVGASVAAFAVGDLNQDGQPDIAVGITEPPEVGLLFGVGDGTFKAGVSVPLPSAPEDVAIVDVDGDARQDLAVTFGVDSTVGVFLGQTHGTFDGDLLFSTKAVSGITPGDLNADGHVELVTWGNGNTDAISLFLGSGQGGFVRRLDYAGKAAGAAVVDFNRDGHQDLVMVDAVGIAIFIGAGDGTFTCEARYVGDSMRDLGVGDLNRDGRLDLVTTSRAGVNVFLSSSP